MVTYSEAELWGFVRTERASLAQDLRFLGESQWTNDTLCEQWNVQKVVAHLSAAASLNQWQWMKSMAGAGFRPAVHNQRRLKKHLGSEPKETLQHFEAVINSQVAPSKDTAAYLGEVLVHAQDIRRPLGIEREPSVAALTPVACFFATRNFAVSSRSVAAGLELSATDGEFHSGSGPLVSGPTLALVMVMAGRQVFLDALTGPGVEILRNRLAQSK